MKRVPYKRGEQTFEPRNVLYLIGESNYSYVHLANGDVILSCRNLKWFADQWPTFIRLHKGALINMNYIQRYERSEAGNRATCIVMSDNAYLPIARRRVPEVLGMLAEMELV